LHVVDASHPHAEDQIQAVNAVLKEIDCADKPSLLVLNKIDRLKDPTRLTILQAHHPKSIAVSAVKRTGLDELRDAVIGALSHDFVASEVATEVTNGRVLAYLNAHAEIYRQEYRGDHVVVSCHLPKHLLHHIQGPDVQVRFK